MSWPDHPQTPWSLTAANIGQSALLLLDQTLTTMQVKGQYSLESAAVQTGFEILCNSLPFCEWIKIV